MKVLLVILLVLLLWIVYKFFFGEGEVSVRTELPNELRHAKIWGKEKRFEVGGDAPMVGVLDECFELDSGVLVVTETKTRARKAVYGSDILQLSGYKHLLEEKTGKEVLGQGFVRLITPEGNEYVPVRLLPKEEVIAARHMYEDLRSGLYAGKKCTNPAICNGCAYKEECDSMG